MPSRDDDTFQAAFERHFEEIYGYLAFRLAPNLDAAQDLAQEVFLAALKTWDSYRGEAPRLHWLRSIARRMVADHYSRSKPKTSLDDVKPTVSRASGVSESQEQAEALSAVMRLLPAEYAELLEDKYIVGRSVADIARRRRKSDKAIESALSRARAMLREKYLRLQAKQETTHERS